MNLPKIIRVFEHKCVISLTNSRLFIHFFHFYYKFTGYVIRDVNFLLSRDQESFSLTSASISRVTFSRVAWPVGESCWWQREIYLKIRRSRLYRDANPAPASLVALATELAGVTERGGKGVLRGVTGWKTTRGRRRLCDWNLKYLIGKEEPEGS